MQKIINFFILLSFVAVFGCSNKNTGWTQADRDKMINSCADEAKKKSAVINDLTLRKYCSCYEESLEKKYPDITKLEKAPKEEVIKSAEECVQLLIK
jgi:hypothetical protein